MRESWHVLHPATPFVPNWHVDLICAHLEAVTFGRLLALGYENRLRFNIPPGTVKSLTVSVMWQAWEWGPAGMPHLQYMSATYREDYALRDSRKTRDLIESEWYRVRWGDSVQLTSRGDGFFENTARGFRKAVPFASLTAGRANRVIIDDPHSIDTAESETERATTTRRFRESVPSRVNDPVRDAIVVMMQRLHMHDVSGQIEQLGLPYVSVVLPMEFEVARRCVTPIGRDPRQHEGDLLEPERRPRSVVDRDKKVLGEYAVAAQFQQRPAPREGGMFKRHFFTPVPAVPVTRVRVRAWDLAATKAKAGANVANPVSSGPSFTAGVRMSYAAGIFYIEHAVRLRGSPAEVESLIKTTATTDRSSYPRIRISIPQDPGQSGVSQKAAYSKLLAGHDVRFSPESGDKVDRANPLSAQAEAGNVRIVVTGDHAADAWVDSYLDELCLFPAGLKDQTDASSRAFAALMEIVGAEEGDLGMPVQAGATSSAAAAAAALGLPAGAYDEDDEDAA